MSAFGFLRADVNENIVTTCARMSRCFHDLFSSMQRQVCARLLTACVDRRLCFPTVGSLSTCLSTRSKRSCVVGAALAVTERSGHIWRHQCCRRRRTTSFCSDTARPSRVTTHCVPQCSTISTLHCVRVDVRGEGHSISFRGRIRTPCNDFCGKSHGDQK